MPLYSGIRMSSVAMSGFSERLFSNASVPVPASPTISTSSNRAIKLDMELLIAAVSSAIILYERDHGPSGL